MFQRSQGLKALSQVFQSNICDLGTSIQRIKFFDIKIFTDLEKPKKRDFKKVSVWRACPKEFSAASVISSYLLK